MNSMSWESCIQIIENYFPDSMQMCQTNAFMLSAVQKGNPIEIMKSLIEFEFESESGINTGLISQVSTHFRLPSAPMHISPNVCLAIGLSLHKEFFPTIVALIALMACHSTRHQTSTTYLIVSSC